jgi:hypothetical protein
MVKSSFYTIKYKQGWIHINSFKSEITGKCGEEFSYTPFDGCGSFPCKSLHSGKMLITKATKNK